jgi:uncharacterized membrane protein YphA (DoxX/SURF4 family)
MFISICIVESVTVLFTVVTIVLWHDSWKSEESNQKSRPVTVLFTVVTIVLWHDSWEESNQKSRPVTVLFTVVTIVLWHDSWKSEEENCKQWYNGVSITIYFIYKKSIKRMLVQIIFNAFLKLLISLAKSLKQLEGGYISWCLCTWDFYETSSSELLVEKN